MICSKSTALTLHFCVMLQDTADKTGQLKERLQKEKKCIWEKKKMRLRGMKWRERESREQEEEERGPTDFWDSLVFFWSLNCTPPFPFFSLTPPTPTPPPVPSCQVDSLSHACRDEALGWMGGGGGGDCSCRWLDHMWHCKPFCPGAALLKSSSFHWLTVTRRRAALLSSFLSVLPGMTCNCQIKCLR